MRDCFFSPTVPLPMFTNMDRMVKQLREGLSPRASCCCRGELSPHRASFWLKMYGACSSVDGHLKKIITRVINATAGRTFANVFVLCLLLYPAPVGKQCVRACSYIRTHRWSVHYAFSFHLPSVWVHNIFSLWKYYTSKFHNAFCIAVDRNVIEGVKVVNNSSIKWWQHYSWINRR